VPSVISYLLPFTPYPYRGEPAACDLCGSTGTETICEHDRRLKRLRTVACIQCGLMRTDPMPTLTEISQYYADTYRLDYGLSTGGPSKRHLTRSRREAALRLKCLKPALNADARILDFGCGAGVFLSQAKAAGHDVLGIEPGKQFANYARQTFGVEVMNELWENVDPPGKFDVITTVEVLEHLRNPVKALAWLAQLLTDDGVIYVTVPNMLPNKAETFRRFHFAHLYNFTPTTLSWAGAAAGLQPDPRFQFSGTRMVFRKDRDNTGLPAFDRNHGEGLRELYPHASIVRHLLGGRWLVSAGKRLKKTIGDSLSRA